MKNRIIGGEAPFNKGASIGVGFMGNPSAAFQDLDGQIENVEIITEENKNKIAGKLGWGTAGLVTFGAAGALAGLLLGGKKKEICFACYLKNGKKFVAVAEPNVYKIFLGNSFKKVKVQPQPPAQHSSPSQTAQPKQSKPVNWSLNTTNNSPPEHTDPPPSKDGANKLQGCGYIAVLIGFLLLMVFIGNIVANSHSSLASNILLLICAASLIIWGLGLISPQVLSRFSKDNSTQTTVSKTLGWVALISFLLFAVTLPSEKTDATVPQSPSISETPKPEASSLAANDHRREEVEAKAKATADAKAKAVEQEKIVEARKKAQASENRMKKLVIKELPNYSKAGDNWRNFLIHHNTSKDNLIFLAHKIHQEDPNSCFRFLDDDSKFDEFMQWDINYPNQDYSYPEDWADNHIIGIVNKMFTSNGQRWELSDGYETIAPM